MALMKPAPTYEGVCADLRSAISNETKCRETLQFVNSNEYNFNGNGNHNNDGNNFKDNEVNWTDRTYRGRGKDKNNFRQNTRGSYQDNSRRYRPGSHKNNQYQRQKKCFICQEVGCWSTRHPPEERKQAATKWQHTAISTGRNATPEAYQNFLVYCEGIECWPETDPIDEMEQLMAEIEMENQEEFENFFTEFGILNGTATIAILHDQSVLHAISQQNPFDPTVYCNPRETNDVFTFNDRYSSDNFQGIMPDSGAAGVSTAGHPQFQALQKLMPSLQLD
ncbi:hypothetical protein K3495_g15600, partial [Podosphaera aphanis]